MHRGSGGGVWRGGGPFGTYAGPPRGPPPPPHHLPQQQQQQYPPRNSIDPNKSAKQVERERLRAERQNHRSSDPAVRAAEQAERDARTLQLTNLPTKANEDDVAEFFEQNAGPVLDVQLITDRFTRRSKGVGYVEFTDLASVPAALACTGRPLLNQPITVAATQSQRNKLAANQVAAILQRGPRQLFIGGLPAGITEADITSLCNCVGVVEQCSVRAGLNGGVPELHAYVVLATPEHAVQLMNELQDAELGGLKLRCGLIDDQGPPLPPAPAMLAPQLALPMMAQFMPLAVNPVVLPPLPTGQIGGNMFANVGNAPESLEQDLPRLNAAGKQALMLQLQRRAESSRAVVLRNMFDPPGSAAARQSGEPFDAAAIRDDVREEVSNYGKLLHCVVEAASGCVYLTFDSVDSAHRCITALHQRWFGGKMIIAEFIEEQRVPS